MKFHPEIGMLPLGVRGPISFPAFCSTLKSFPLQPVHAKHRSLSVIHDVKMCGSSKRTKPAIRVMQSAVFASLAFVCVASVPSFASVEGMDAVTGEVLFQARCYQCHAGKNTQSYAKTRDPLVYWQASSVLFSALLETSFYRATIPPFFYLRSQTDN